MVAARKSKKNADPKPPVVEAAPPPPAVDTPPPERVPAVELTTGPAAVKLPHDVTKAHERIRELEQQLHDRTHERDIAREQLAHMSEKGNAQRAKIRELEARLR